MRGTKSAAEGPEEQLLANVEAAKTAIEACHCLSNALRDQHSAIARENRHAKLMLDAAVNTYKTIRLGMNVAELMKECREAFGALRRLRLPRFRKPRSRKEWLAIRRAFERLVLLAGGCCDPVLPEGLARMKFKAGQKGRKGASLAQKV